MNLLNIQTGRYFRKVAVILVCLSMPISCQSVANGSNEKKEPAPAQTQSKTKNYHGNLHVEKTISTNEFRPAPATATSVEGRKLYDKFNCAQCHQIEHAGGYAGPSLDGVGQYGRTYVSAHINNPQAEAVKKDKFFELVPTSMPEFSITPEQAGKITDYLMTLRSPN